MISRRRKLAGILLMLSISARAADSAWVIRQDGIGPVTVGMSLLQLKKTLNIPVSLSYSEDSDSKACFYADSKKYPDFDFMIENGHVSRVDISGPSVATAEGVRVGDSVTHLKQIYGRQLKRTTNAYSDDPVFTIGPGNGHYAIRFIMDQQKVRLIYAGRWTSVQYIEGCE